MTWIDPYEVERSLENVGREIAYRSRVPRHSVVPTLIGMPFHEAMDACLAGHLHLRHDADPELAEGEGVVVGQEPQAGARVKPKTVVTVHLSFGDAPE